MTHTHQKRPYRANAVQWDGDNYAEIEPLFENVNAYITLYGSQFLVIRFQLRLYTLSPGWWVVVGENGDVKCYSDEVFRVKYEPTRKPDSDHSHPVATGSDI